MKNDKQLPIPTPNWVMLSPLARFAQGPRRFKRQSEVVDTSSRTIPDDSFSIADLFNRYQKGQPLPLGLERPVRFEDQPSHDDLDLESIRRMDIAVVNDYKKRVSDTLFHLNERQKALAEAETAAKLANAAPKADNNA